MSHTPPPDQHVLVYETRSQMEAFELKKLIYHYNSDTVRSVRIDWREGRPRLGCDRPWYYRVNVMGTEPLRSVMQKAVQNLPTNYQDRVLGWYDNKYRRRPRLRKEIA